MFEIYIVLLIFTVLIILIYKKFNKELYEEGDFLTINKDIKIDYNINWDISDKSVVKVVNFKQWKRFFFGSDLYASIKKNQGIVFKIEDHSILDVCDKEMNSIHHIVNPELAIFSDEDDPRIYRLETGKKYTFFLRTDKDKNKNSKVYKILDMKKTRISGKKKDCQMCYMDEDELFKVFYSECEEIRNGMLRRGYNLVNVLKSKEYLSFPNNSISNKLSVDSELGDVLILVTTNKMITSEMKNHIVEVNSSNNSFTWKPEGDKSIVHLFLDNCDQQDTFLFYERTTNVVNGSNILPFQVLLFRR